jgi:phospho-N-acetylmuramoyl-pentapeptide-transferase
MLYSLFEWFAKNGIKFPGSGLVHFITFRVLIAVLLSLIITMIYGKRVIRILKKKQIGESVRELGLAGEKMKSGTPTMGGIIILLAIVVPTLLLANLNKVYVILMLLCTVWLGVIGFVDDYLKIKAKRIAKEKGVDFKKTNADGLAGKFKIFGQVILGIIIGATLYFNPSVVVKREIIGSKSLSTYVPQRGEHKVGEDTLIANGQMHRFVTVKTPITTIPFVKNHEFNYARLLPASWEDYTYILYILIVIFIVTAVSNGANITDGLDGLATGVSAIIGLGLGIFVFVSGDLRVAEYLNIMYIPNLSELSIFIAAFVGACVGFLWYNAYPAQVFMGDTGSLALGGAMGTMMVLCKKEFVLPIVGGIFFLESLSVILQTGYFKTSRKMYGEGRRIFRMAPLHHHFELSGWAESKIVTRAYIAAIILALLALTTFNVR